MNFDRTQVTYITPVPAVCGETAVRGVLEKSVTTPVLRNNKLTHGAERLGRGEEESGNGGGELHNYILVSEDILSNHFFREEKKPLFPRLLSTYYIVFVSLSLSLSSLVLLNYYSCSR